MEFFIKLFNQSVHPCKCVMAWWLGFTVYMCSSEMWITESWVKYVDHWTLFLVEPRCLLRTVLVPWCLMLPVRAWLLGWLVLRQSSAWWQVSMWVQMFFLLFLQSKTVLKKWVLALFLINTCLNQVTLLLEFNGKLENEPLHLKQVVSPSWWHVLGPHLATRARVHLELWERARVSFQTFFFFLIYACYLFRFYFVSVILLTRPPCGLRYYYCCFKN